MLLLSRGDNTASPLPPVPKRLTLVERENKIMDTAIRCAQSITQAVSPIFQIVRMAPVPIAALDTEMRYVVTSQRWFEVYNLARFCGVYENLQGKSHYDAFPTIKTNKPEWMQQHQRVIHEGVTLSSEGLDWFIDLDGSKVYLEWEIAPWFKDTAAREVGGVILYCHNVKRVQDTQTVCPVCRSTCDGE